MKINQFLFLYLLLFTPLVALPIGNPIDASLYTNSLFLDDCYDERTSDPCDPCFSWCDAWSFRIGFYGDYVYNRNMELDGCGSHDIDDVQIYTNAGYLALNICDRLDLFGTLGATHIDMWANADVFESVRIAQRIEVNSGTAFSWSAGGRLTIWNCDCFYFGIESQYFCTKPKINFVDTPSGRGQGALSYPDDNSEVKYDEWQVGLGAAYLMHIGCSGVSAIPYVGLKWARSYADFDNATPAPNITLFKLKSKKLWGYGVGTTLLLCDTFGITIEGRFADEKAIHVNGQIRF